MSKTLDVMVVGEVYVDHVMSGFQRWPALGEEVVTDAYVREIGGGAATTACGLGRLGRAVGLMALVGEADTPWFEARLGDFSMDGSAIRRRPGPTGVTLSVSTREDRSFFTHVGVNADLPALLAEASTLAALRRARHVHFALPLGRAAASTLLPALKAQGCGVSLDMGYQPAWFADPANRASMAAVDHLIPNEKEAALLCGFEGEGAYLRFAAEAGFALPMVKLGARGAVALDAAGEMVRAAPPTVEAVDTTGAGDAFDAGFIHALLDGASALERLRWGCVCGALQETTGPTGAAMALRTVPVALEHARAVQAHAPDAWIVSFTNPAGLITQALSSRKSAKVVGICDTPTELFHNIAHAMGAQLHEVECDYVGLNHLGWVRGVRLRGEDVFDRLIRDDELLSKLYSAPLFDGAMIRALRLIPTEYLFFYYERRRALANQRQHGSSRGAEVETLNHEPIATLKDRLGAGDGEGAVAAYAAYLNRRSGSYMRLEAKGGSAFDADASFDVDPFRTASGYHRIAIDVMSALSGARPGRIVVNTPGRGVLADLPGDDVIETTCRIDADTITPEPIASLHDPVAGLVRSIKAYERAAINAALSEDRDTARKALLIHPAIGEWGPTEGLLQDLLHPTCVHC